MKIIYIYIKSALKMSGNIAKCINNKFLKFHICRYCYFLISMVCSIYFVTDLQSEEGIEICRRNSNYNCQLIFNPSLILQNV